jgi:hypothetical protein
MPQQRRTVVTPPRKKQLGGKQIKRGTLPR